MEKSSNVHSISYKIGLLAYRPRSSLKFASFIAFRIFFFIFIPHWKVVTGSNEKWKCQFGDDVCPSNDCKKKWRKCSAENEINSLCRHGRDVEKFGNYTKLISRGACKSVLDILFSFSRFFALGVFFSFVQWHSHKDKHEIKRRIEPLATEFVGKSGKIH